MVMVFFWMISLGLYPDVSLSKARSLALDARKQVMDGEAPKGVKAARETKTETFFALVDEWIAQQGHRSARTLQRYQLLRSRLGTIGSLKPRNITPMILVELCRRVADEHSPYQAHRQLTFIAQVMRYGIPSGRVLQDPTIGVRNGLPRGEQGKHRAAITKPSEQRDSEGNLLPDSVRLTKFGKFLRSTSLDELPELLNWIDSYDSLVVRSFLQLMALFWCRSSELTQARWEDIDWEQKLYRIPAERMKMRQEHLVPISRQAEQILRTLRASCRASDFVFPSTWNNKSRPIHIATPMRVLRTKFDGQMTVHGFRSTASTLLNERGWNPDVIEAQLAHQDANAVRRAYNRAQYLEDRRRMMQEWADYLDELRAKN